MADQLLLLSVANDKKRLTIAPGANDEFTIVAKNLSPRADRLHLQIDGINPAWAQIPESEQDQMVKEQRDVRVIFTLPLEPTQCTAGIYPFQVYGTLRDNGAQAEVTAELEIELVGDYHLELGENKTPQARDATFDVRFKNEANAVLQVHCNCSDKESDAWYKFDPYLIEIPAAGENTILLTARGRKPGAEPHRVFFELAAAGVFQLTNESTEVAPEQRVTGEFVALPAPKAPPRLVMTIEPPQVESAAAAAYEVRVKNSGQQTAAIQLRGAIDDNSLKFEFDAREFDLVPDAEMLSKLEVIPLTPLKRNEAPEKNFRVIATPVNGEAPPASVEAKYVRLPKEFPGWIIAGAIAGVLLGVTLFAFALVFLDETHWLR